MKLTHWAVAALLATTLAIPSRALVSIDDGAEHIYVNLSVTAGYDSNLFGRADSPGSTFLETQYGAELIRNHGIIAVDAKAEFDFMHYFNLTGQDYVDPLFEATFSKITGPNEWTLALTAQKEDRMDVDVLNVDTSWDYEANFTVKHPINSRYSIADTVDWTYAEYANQQLFTNLWTLSDSVRLLYALDSTRDLFIEYRERYSQLGDGSKWLDSGVSGGVSGRVIGPIDGSIQLGYQERQEWGPFNPGVYDDMFAAASLTWKLNRTQSLAGTATRDFCTTAQGQSIEQSRVGLTFRDALTNRFDATLEASGGQDRFFGQRRIDDFAEFTGALSYKLTNHLKVFASYEHYRNWSTIDLASFPRTQYSLTLSARF